MHVLKYEIAKCMQQAFEIYSEMDTLECQELEAENGSVGLKTLNVREEFKTARGQLGLMGN